MTKAFSPSRLAIHATLLFAAALYLVPLVVMLLTSFKPVSYTHLRAHET